MRLLLDTHALIWWQVGAERLPSRTREALADEKSDVYFSSVNAFEIAIKHRLGKLPLVEKLMDRFEPAMAEQGFLELPVTAQHALAAGRLEIDHRDPFDRLLIAQALVEDLTLVSNEELFDRAGVSRLWG